MFNGRENLSVVGIGKKSMTRSSLQQKIKTPNFSACELWVYMVVIFGMVLYQNQ